MAETAVDATAPQAPATGGLPRRWILMLLMGAYTLSYLDRQVVTILAESIKRDLHITNTELGMISGLAFAMFYTFLGVPIAREAEKRSRPMIIAVSMALWSAFTVLSGRAGSFPVMALARLGVGFGEAGCNPAAHSLIADITPPAQRGSALAFYSLGVPFGTMLGLVLGGAIADAYGWRTAFMVAGAPGLILSLIIFLFVKEPRLHAAAHEQAAAVSAGNLRHTLSIVRTKPTYWLIAVAAGLLAFVGYGNGAFGTPFFLRVHGRDVAAISHALGMGPLVFLGLSGALTTGIGALIGTWIGGWAADRAAKADKRAYMTLPAICSLISVPIMWTVYIIPNTVVALALGLLPAALQTVWYGPVYATGQGVVPPANRATAAAIMLLVLNFIGLGLGPITVGALNDLLAGPTFGLGQAEGLRVALILSASVVLVSGLLFWLARRSVRQDIVS